VRFKWFALTAGVGLDIGAIAVLVWLLTGRGMPIDVGPDLPASGMPGTDVVEGAAGASLASPIHYVAINGTDSGDCSTPASACLTIQYAVDRADEGDEIRVASGVYTGVSGRPRDDLETTGVVTQVVYIGKTVIVRGGYTVTNWSVSHPLTQPTTLDAEGAGRVFYVTGDVSPTIEGFIITGGNAAGLGGALIDEVLADMGGGIYVGKANPVILNNIITGNVASTLSHTVGVGGGVGVYSNSASTVISGNHIFFNVASTGFRGQGGGLRLERGVAAISGNTVCFNVGSTAHRGSGGGIYISGDGVTVIGNVVQGNIGSTAAEGGGGGIAVTDSDNAVVSGNTVRLNIASTGGYGKGGGLGLKWDTNLLVSDNYVEGNIGSTAEWGQGGGILLKHSEDVTVSDNAVLLNTASTSDVGKGGGFFVAWNSHVTLDSNRVQENIASVSGGGLAGGLFLWSNDAATLTNNLVADNQANTAGGGIYVQGSSPRLLHTTLVRNTGGDGSGIYVTTDREISYSAVALTNTILVSHVVGVFVTAGNTVTLEATLWGGGAWANGDDWSGPGMVNHTDDQTGDPAFVDPNAGDYHIGLASAAMDAGVTTDVDDDIDGDPRPQGMGYDIGADETGLVVTKRASPGIVPSGTRLTYTVRAANHSGVTLTMAITDVLPNHVTPTGVLTWRPVTIAPGSAWTQTAIVTVEAGYAGPLTNVVWATSEEGATGACATASLTSWAGHGIYLPLVLRGY